MKSFPEVEYAEPNYKVYITADVPVGYNTEGRGSQSAKSLKVSSSPETTASVICSNPSSNPLYFRQYGITQQNIHKLWNKPIINKKRPVIAILDTGVDITHPDLVDNIWTNTQEAEGETAYDDDGNSIVDDIHGWNFVEDYSDLTDRNGHGTHCAGIAAAVDNNLGIVGANPLALIMPVKVMDDRGQGDVGTIARGINYAVENEVIAKSPCKGITTPKTDDILAKDILSEQELQKLFATHYAGENPEIRRAFAMTCLSGIRHCDIVTLTYSEVDYSNKILKFRQNKTKKHSSSSGVTIPLNDTLLNIIGVKAPDAKDDYIFHLPSDTMCLKALRHWTKKAGIDKHITWHCGRHSFGTQLLNNGANIKVVSSLLGHSSLRFTEIYVRAVDEEKKKAINSMPNIDIF